MFPCVTLIGVISAVSLLRSENERGRVFYFLEKYFLVQGTFIVYNMAKSMNKMQKLILTCAYHDHFVRYNVSSAFTKFYFISYCVTDQCVDLI